MRREINKTQWKKPILISHYERIKIGFYYCIGFYQLNLH